MEYMIQGLIPGRYKIFFSPPKCAHQLWGPSSFLFNGHRGFFLEVKQLSY
jgi:hypothetical protein